MEEEKISFEGRTLAYVVRAESIKEVSGQKFYGDQDHFMQVGVMGLEKGRKLRPHAHYPQNKKITKNQEVLLILKGKLEVTFYSDTTYQEVAHRILYAGDLIVLLEGGHGFDIQEDTKLIEVKQGPYEGQAKDKKYLDR